MNDVNVMTKKEIMSVRYREASEDIGRFGSLVIIPMVGKNNLHDSGYRAMDFVAVKDNKPLRRLSGISDVIHIDGIGGLGHNWMEKHKGRIDNITTRPKSWSIDCLAKSGLLRIFVGGYDLIADMGTFSSFEIFAVATARKGGEERPND